MSSRAPVLLLAYSGKTHYADKSWRGFGRDRGLCGRPFVGDRHPAFIPIVTPQLATCRFCLTSARKWPDRVRTDEFDLTGAADLGTIDPAQYPAMERVLRALRTSA